MSSTSGKQQLTSDSDLAEQANSVASQAAQLDSSTPSSCSKTAHSLSQAELTDLFRLKAINGVGPTGASKLLSYFGNPTKVMQASDQALRESGLTDKLIKALRAVDDQAFEKTFEWLDHPNHWVIPLDSTHYPSLLAQTATPPLFLFAVGNLELLHSPQIAVVGSRSPTPQGSANTHTFCQQLVAEGLTVTSGLALGVDGEAHRAALAHKGYTIAVTGTGLARVYPASHKQLAHAIAKQGLLVSECFPYEGVSAGSFPKRNRIIAGLSLGTLVIEAAKKSGSLITAHIAMEEAREVFAVPGTITNPMARGCHALIRQGAKLVENAQDILEELPALMSAQRQTLVSETRPELNLQATEFLKQIDYETTSLDTIMLRTQLPLESVTNMLLLLELDGWVTNTTGGYMRL